MYKSESLKESEILNGLSFCDYDSIFFVPFEHECIYALLHKECRILTFILCNVKCITLTLSSFICKQMYCYRTIAIPYNEYYKIICFSRKCLNQPPC